MEGAGGKELRPCWVTTVPRASIFRLAGLGDLSEQTPRGPLTSSSREDESPRETSCRALLEPRPREVRGWGRPVAHLGHPGLQTSNPPHFKGAGGGPSRGSRRWRQREVPGVQERGAGFHPLPAPPSSNGTSIFLALRASSGLSRFCARSSI